MSNDIRQTMASTSWKSCGEMMDSVAKDLNFAVVDIIGEVDCVNFRYRAVIPTSFPVSFLT